MARLYRLERTGDITTAEEKPFTSEVDEMEPFVKKNHRILGDVFIFGEQTSSSSKDKRTDLLAVDRDGQFLIIELKKDHVGSEILPQVLGYQLWWKKHPDSAKSLWMQRRDRPDDVEPDWGSYDPKVVVVAPSFDDELVEISADRNLGFRFVEVARYEHSESTFVAVNEVALPRTRVSPVSTQQDYDWNWYAENVAYTDAEVDIARSLFEGITRLCKERNWNLEPKFNKNYVSFKHGGSRPFWLEFRHKGKVAVSTILWDEKDDPSEKTATKWQWDKNWKFWYTEVDDASFDVKTLTPALEAAYKAAIQG